MENSYVLNDSNFIGLSISYNRFAKNYGEGSQHFDTECNSKLTESSESRLQSPARSTTYLTNIYYNGKIGNLKIDFNTDYMKYSKKNGCLYKKYGKKQIITILNKLILIGETGTYYLLQNLY